MSYFVFTLLTLVATILTAHAHPNLQNSLAVDFTPSRVRLGVNVSVKELSVAHGVQGLPVNGVGRLDTAAIKHAADDHRDYVLKHLKLTAGTTILEGKITGMTSPPFFADPTQTFYQYQIEYPLSGQQPLAIGLYHDMLKEWPYSAGTSWDVSYVVRIQQTENPQDTSWLLRYQQAITIPTGLKIAVAIPAITATDPALVTTAAAGWRSFREYLWHGILHILTGYDHLLFIAALVIATLNFWEMVKVIAAFTIAHSLTLALCVFGFVRLPASIVEPVIALSIVFVALENVLRPQHAHSKLRLAVAFGFGLIHGLGFAGGLLDAMAGLPAIGIWIALLAFSLGVEIGHQLVVLPLFGLLKVSRCYGLPRKQTQILRYGSAIIGCGGIYYLVVAVQQQFLGH